MHLKKNIQNFIDVFSQKNKNKKEGKNVVSHLLMDHWIHKLANNNKIKIIQAKCLIKVKIGFSKEIFAYTCLLPIIFPKITKLSQNFQYSQNFQIKGLPKWLPLPKNIFTLGSEK